MINWTIKIQSPILTLGMSFQVKYRKLPSTTWVSFMPNPTTNEFTITNLENGDYEAEIRTVCTNGELSHPVYVTTVTGSACPVVTDLAFTENVVDPGSYQYRSFTFNWTRQNGSLYRLEFQKSGASAGFNDSAPGMNTNTPVTITGLNIDKVRVVTICGATEVNSDWLDISASEPPQYPLLSFYYIAREGHVGYITYSNEYGVTHVRELQPSHYEDEVWVEAECTEIIAYQILSVTGANKCTV